MAGQLFFEIVDSEAGSFGKSKEKFGLYENLFHETSLPDLVGTNLSFKDIKAPVVLMNFWASWCTPCLKEFPSLNKLRAMFDKKDLQILGVNSDEEEQIKNIKKTIQKYDIKFDVLVDKESKVTSKYLISEIPMSIIYHKGKVVDVVTGETDFSSPEFTAKLNKWLGKKEK